MNIIVHNANGRGRADHGWLQANHSFSFANYFDKDKIQFGALRVLNDDKIAPKMGFGTHPHDNMEIITIPLQGILKHRDNMNADWQSVLPDEVQVMSAGTGVQHSEINGSATEFLSLFQIWIIPNKRNVEPRYDQKQFDPKNRQNNIQTLVASIDDSEYPDALKIHQDAKISRLDLSKDTSFEYDIKSSNHGVYLMAINGEVQVADHILGSRDAIGISNASSVKIKAISNTELLLIEVPMI